MEALGNLLCVFFYLSKCRLHDTVSFQLGHGSFAITQFSKNLLGVLTQGGWTTANLAWSSR